MKKLSMLCGWTLVLALIAGPAFAMSFETDLDQANPLDYETQVTIMESDNIQIDIWLTDYTPDATSELKSVDYYLYWDTDQLDYVSSSVNAANWPGSVSTPKTDGSGLILGVINSAAPFMPTDGLDSDSVMLHSVILHCKNETDLGANPLGDLVEVELDNRLEGPAGAVYNKNGWDFYPTAALCYITQTVPQCACEITPGSATLSDSSLVVTFAGGDNGNCDNTAVYVYTDDCLNGAVDSVSGVFTADDPAVDETCTVTATDTANTTNDPAPGSPVVCTADVTIEATPLCNIEIYEGGAPVPPCNTYNKPGRRGIMLTCGDTVQFSECSDCVSEGNPDCVDNEWSLAVVSGIPPAGTSIDPVTGLLTIGPDCTDLDAVVEIDITVVCHDNGDITDTVTVFVGEVTLAVVDAKVSPTAGATQATITLDNPNHAVKAIEVKLRDATDCLTCTGCTPDADRAIDYTCSAAEQTDGTCKVILASFNPAGMIEEGSGAIFTVDYVGDCPGCVTIYNDGYLLNVADRFGDPLCVCFVEGEICEFACGDVYPRECLPDDPECGDGVVDIFDILEEIDFILNVIDPSVCQEGRADVPTGTPPYCGCVGDEICQTDGVIDIFDLLVIIDMALGKANCCDYCASGTIF